MSNKEQTSNSILKKLNPTRIIIPILIGLGATVYLIYRDISKENMLESLSNPNWAWLFLAVVVLVFRDGFYIYRIRYLTDKLLSWTGSFYTIILWEFSSALSPSAVGGTAVASFLLLKEGISFGKSLAYVLVSAILDNSFFIVFGGIVLLADYLGFFPGGGLWDFEGVNAGFVATLKFAFYIGYPVITAYTLLMMYGLFIKPEFIKWLFIKITSIRWLKRWQKAATKQGDEIVIASKELKGKSLAYWAKAIISTILIWTSRYFIVNCLLAAFSDISFGEHIFILSRHVILWVILLIGITPGAAGVAELAFGAFFKPFVAGLAGIIAALWRLFTYYLYLALGAIFLFTWIPRVFNNQSTTNDDQEEEVSLNTES